VYPAYDALDRDPELTYSRWRVYRALRPPFLSFTEPREVKIAVVKARAKVGTGRASEALAWLERRGYVVVHSRDRRGMPSITLAYDAPTLTDVERFPARNKRAG
jgi:hypothetical protein